MPTVPRGPSSPDMPVPSETDFWMALATMKELGRFPTFDERFRGQDPSSLPLDVQAKGRPVYGIPKGSKGMSADMSYEPEPGARDLIERQMKRRSEFQSASTGVSGGSR